jgi:hypothetical protein
MGLIRYVVSAIAGVVVLASSMQANAAGAAVPPEVFVEADGALPGFRPADLPGYLAAQMNSAKAGPSRFTPAPSPKPNDRITWSFKIAPQAQGAVRSYGFSDAMMKRLGGASHLIVMIEGRLFIHGAYEAVVSGEIDWRGDPKDPDLADKIGLLTQELMAVPGIIG